MKIGIIGAGNNARLPASQLQHDEDLGRTGMVPDCASCGRWVIAQKQTLVESSFCTEPRRWLAFNLPELLRSGKS